MGTEIPRIDARGGAAEIGHTVGTTVASTVRCAEAYYNGLLDKAAAYLRNRVSRLAATLQERFPAVTLELDAVADAAGLPRSRILSFNLYADALADVRACTNIAVRGPDGPLLAKTVDASRIETELVVEERRVGTGQFPFLHWTVAGSAWSEGGLNDRGLALVNAGLYPTRFNSEGSPCFILMRELLAQCACVAEASAWLAGHDVAGSGNNIILADSSGEMRLITKLPGVQSERSGDVLWCTNTSVHNEQVHSSNYQTHGLALLKENSRARDATLAKCISRTPATKEDLAGILKLHRRTGSICQHGGDGFFTAVAFVLDPIRREATVLPGPPCHSAAREESVTLRSTTRLGLRS
jgi:predicted choloylglycine hydrolase